MTSFQCCTDLLPYWLCFSCFVHPNYCPASPAQKLNELVECMNRKAEDKDVAVAESLKDLRQSLSIQVKQPKNNAPRKGLISLAECGAASLQVFSGQDESFREMKKVHQEQIRVWADDAVATKQQEQAQQAREDEEYAIFVRDQDDMLKYQLDKSVQNRQRVEQEIFFHNLELARQANARKQQENKNDTHAQAFPLLAEDTGMQVNVENPNRFRPDHYKGLSPEQSQQILLENQMVLAEKRRLEHFRDEEEREWAQENLKMIKKMEEADALQQQKAKEENDLQREILLKQRLDLIKRKEAEKKKEEIGSQFFCRFGQSCR